MNAHADGINFPIAGMTTRKQGFHRGHQTKCVISDGPRMLGARYLPEGDPKVI